MTHRRKHPPRRWKPWADQYLREHYDGGDVRSMARKVCRTMTAVRQRAMKLGIGKARPKVRPQVSPERYFEMMPEAAIASGIKPAVLLRDNGPRKYKPIKFAVWAALRDEGTSYKSIADAGGLDHSSIINGCRRHAEIQAAQ